MTNRQKAQATFALRGKPVKQGPYIVTKPHATFGTGLKAVRELAGWSLRDVESATGVSNAYVSQLESNKIRRPSVFILFKLAAFYGIDRAHLLESLPDMPPLANPIEAKWRWLPPPRNDEEQIEMANYLKLIRARGARILKTPEDWNPLPPMRKNSEEDANRLGGKHNPVGPRLK